MSGASTDRAAGGSPPIEVVRRLSPEDLSILALETEIVAGHTCKVIVLGDRVDSALLRASIAARLDNALPLRLRLSEIDGEPWWVSDPDLDLRAHVVVHHDSGSVDMTGLGVVVARLFEQRLDRSLPLWRLDLIPELSGGGSALIWRLHHAVADGQTAMRVARTALWDEGPTAEIRADGSADRRSPNRKPREAARHQLGGLRAVARETPRPWLRSPFNGHIGARRLVGFASAELEALHRAARVADGATVNDAVLAVVAGGLRHWLEFRHGHLGSIRVKVPVSMHGRLGLGDEAAEPGNRDSFFCLDLPLAPSDPVERLRAVRHATQARKQGHDAEELDSLMRRLADAPPLRRFAERVLTTSRSFALNVSNVPGPRQPVHVLGAPVRALYSIAEIREHHALRIAVISLGNELNFGLTADPTIVPDVEQLATYIEAEAAALVAAA